MRLAIDADTEARLREIAGHRRCSMDEALRYATLRFYCRLRSVKRCALKRRGDVLEISTLEERQR